MQEKPELLRQVESRQTQGTQVTARFQGEMVRKSLHLLIALVPVLASVNLPATIALLAMGTIFYSLAEASRRQGNPVLVVSDLTLIAAREKDMNGFVLGPVTLGLGALLSLLLYPLPAASIAIFALAFGDGFAGLVGTVVRGPRIPFLNGKTLAGSFACFAAVFIVTFGITSRPADSLIVAAAATFLEGIPAGNFDNIIIPFGVGMVAAKLLVP
jgi:dolichol kinase